jgi:hypothetical protein
MRLAVRLSPLLARPIAISTRDLYIPWSHNDGRASTNQMGKSTITSELLKLNSAKFVQPEQGKRSVQVEQSTKRYAFRKPPAPACHGGVSVTFLH